MAPPMSATMPAATSSTNIASAIEEAARMPMVPRFLHLLHNAQDLIHTFGPYSTHMKVFTRSKNPPKSVNNEPTRIQATSLAAAQDSIQRAQPSEPGAQDLALFQHLWSATLCVLARLLETATLDSKAFGWGVYGLASGYTGLNDALFLSRKTRLHNALLLFPDMADNPTQKWRQYRNDLGNPGDEKIQLQKTLRAEIHVCATLLMQQFNREEWKTVRWFHVVKVVERWVGGCMVDECLKDL